MRFKGWFGPKLIGYGVGPRSWEGWALTTLVAVAALATRWVPWQRLGLPRWAETAYLPLVFAAYLAVVWATYDPDV